MPLYEYRCQNCGHEFEKMVRFSEAAKNPVCPKCSGEQTTKKISVFASYGASNASAGAAATACSSPGRFT